MSEGTTSKQTATTAATTEATTKETTAETTKETTEATTEATKETTTEATTEETTTETSESSETTAESTTEATTEATEDDTKLDEEGRYTSKEDVALYIHTYWHLPTNFVTKAQARAKGWSGGSLEDYFPGCSIGGDVFGNREGLLPKKKGRTYYECDIDTKGKSSRGAKRIVYSDDGLIYYTDDHYETFTLLYGEV
ncbi:MAG: ribonuclease [Clostridiales bacterium]|nr:ribonuclease [Clostridiales bacterium]